MAATPNEIHPQLAGLIQQAVANSPGKLLSAPDRYALSVIADGQADRITSDEFAKSAQQGISPDAHAANRAADKMAESLGIVPPPMPAALPAGPQQQGGGRIQTGPNGQPYDVAVQAGAVQGAGGMTPPQTPPGTYFNSTTGRTEWNPNYHGPYATFPSSLIDQHVQGQTDIGGGTGGFVHPPGGQVIEGQGTTISEKPASKEPVQKFAPLNQEAIDHAWDMFDQAMAKMPTPPDPAKLPEVGLTQVLAMAAAGLIDPQAGAVIGKALFEAPVMAKLEVDKDRQQSYADHVRLWQNETQRYQNAALGVERSEVAKQKNLQGSYDTAYKTEMSSYMKDRAQHSSGLRKLDTDLSAEIRSTQAMLAKPLSPDEKAQWTDHLNNLLTDQEQLRSDITGVESGGESHFFTTDGQGTPAYQKLTQDIALSKQRVDESKKRVEDYASKIGMRAEQVERIKTLLPAEFDRMTAQTGMYTANRVRAIYGAMESAQRMRESDFRMSLGRDRFMLDQVKAQASELDKTITEKHKEYQTLVTGAEKADKAAAKAMAEGGYNANTGVWANPAKEAEYKAETAKAQQARDDAEKMTGTIDTMQSAHSALVQGIGEIEAPQATGNTPGYGQVAGQVKALEPKTATFLEKVREHVGQPYKWGGGRQKGPDSEVDCSGLICDAREQAGLPSIGSTAHEQYQRVPSVPKGSPPQPGDLFFFDWKGDGHVDHVGVYTGDGKITMARGGPNTPGNVVEIDAKGYSGLKHLVKIGRPNDTGGPPSSDPKPAQARQPRGQKAAASKPQAHYGQQNEGGR